MCIPQGQIVSSESYFSTASCERVDGWPIHWTRLKKSCKPRRCRFEQTKGSRANAGRRAQRAAARNGTGLIALVIAVSPSRSARASMACTDSVLVWLRSRSARHVCSVRRSIADGTARKRQTWTRLIGRDTSQEPTAAVGYTGLAAMADKAIRRRVPMLSTQWDASHPAHANAIVVIWHVSPVAARAGAALRR
jgi:hypothetical protein